jgi:NMD protein affecting ribosome stability and mRNA decay
MMKKKIPDSITIYTCRFCGRVKAIGDYEEPSKKSIAEAVSHQFKLDDCIIEVEEYDLERKRATIALHCLNDELSFDKRIRLKVEHQTCQLCYRKRSGYYEAVVQIRGESAQVSKALERLEHYLGKHGAFIAKIENVKHGVDVYASDKLVVNGFFAYYRLKPKKSYELYGLKRGKKVYRNIYALILE